MAAAAGTGTGLAVRHFTTDRFAPRHRHEAWRNQDWPRSSGSLLDARAEPGFAAHSDAIAVGPLTLLYGTYGAQTVKRSRQRIVANPIDHLNVSMVEHGTIDGDWIRLEPGELAVSDLAQVFAHHSTDCALISFAVPRPLALAHGIDPRALHGTRVSAPDAALLFAHLRQIRASAATLPESGGAVLAGTVVDLLALALARGAPLTRPPVESAERTLRLRAEQLITSAVEHPDLGVDYLCGALGVSRSALYRVFEEDGGVRTRIRRERLRAAQALLANPAARIGLIADRLGFADPGHFSRAFRTEFGETPRDYRVRAAGDGC